MAATPDQMIEFLLSEIALCGTQGASSADFRRFLQKFHQENPPDSSSPFYTPITAEQSLSRFGDEYFSKVWDWVRQRKDVQVVYQGEGRNLSWHEFEVLEKKEGGSSNAHGRDTTKASKAMDPTPAVKIFKHTTQSQSQGSPSSFSSLSAFGQALRERALAEGLVTLNGDRIEFSKPPSRVGNLRETDHTGHKLGESSSPKTNVSQVVHPIPGPSVLQPSQRPAKDTSEDEEIPLTACIPKAKRHRLTSIIPSHGRMNSENRFETSMPLTSAPRIRVSENRTWRAVAGHATDLKKLPTMQFMLLSIIAAQGANGITQPDLVAQSGQDKRSVPHRTDELAKNGYIVKKPIQSGTFRTSLCIHKRFIKDPRSTKKDVTIDDVYTNGNFMLSDFVWLLNRYLKENRFIPMKHLRTTMGVSVQQWNARAIRTAVRRLDETGMLARRRIYKPGSNDTIVVIKRIRDPTDEDMKNLRFRRKVTSLTGSSGALDDDDDDDDDDEDAMAELDFELNVEEKPSNKGDIVRIPPQWEPNQPLANLIFNIVEQAGPSGIDASQLRDITVGKFWRRAFEAYMSRLTDDWERSQPHHLRHLAIIRDTAVTEEKRFVHYVYRTYGNFQKAYLKGEVAWEAVSKEAEKVRQKKKPGQSEQRSPETPKLDKWGFRPLDPRRFHRQDGKSTLKESNASIDRGRRQYKYRDSALTTDTGDVNLGKQPSGSRRQTQTQAMALAQSREERRKKTELRRIEKYAIAQAARETGVGGNVTTRPTKQARITGTGKAPLLTPEQRQALGLPSRGRLGKDIENRIREYRNTIGDPYAVPDVLFNDGAGDPAAGKGESVGNKPKKRQRSCTSGDQVSEDAHGSEEEDDTNKQKKRRRTTQPSIFTKKFREAHGLPTKGRLKQEIIDRFRNESGLQPASVGTANSAGPAAHAALSKEAGNDDPLGTRTEQESSTALADDGIVAQNSPKSTSNPLKRKFGTEEGSDDATTQAVQSFELYAATLPPSSSSSIGIVPEKDTGSTVQSHVDEGMTSSRAVHSPAVPNIGNEPRTLTKPANLLERITEGPHTPINGKKQTKSTGRIVNQKRVQEIIENFTKRPGPGVYINPFATRPIPRGRPMKALMVIFKSEKLNDFDWFKADPSIVTVKKQPNQRRRRKPAQEAQSLQQTPRPSSEPKNPKAQVSEQKARVNEDAFLPASRTISQSTHPQEDTMEMDRQEVTQPQDHRGASSAQSEPSEQSSAVPSPADGLLYRPPPLRTIPAWNAINTPANTRPEVYQSPYSNPQAMDITHTPSTSRTITPSLPKERSMGISNGANALGHDQSNDVGDLTEIRDLGYKRKPKHGTISNRGVVLGKGNVWRLRTMIILQILRRCGGVFPSNGEIAVPFYPLWEKHVGSHMKAPDRSTLTSTIKNMLGDPEHKIKKIGFNIPSPGGTATPRYIIAFKDIPHTDPRVKSLQNNIIKAHPQRFIPEEVQDLVSVAPERPRSPAPKLDETILMDTSYLPTSRRFDQRIVSSTQHRKAQTAKSQQQSKATESTLETVKVIDEGEKSVGGSDIKGEKGRRLDTLEKKHSRVSRKKNTSNDPPGKANGAKDRNISRGVSPTPSDSSEDVPLAQLRPRQSGRSSFLKGPEHVASHTPRFVLDFASKEQIVQDDTGSTFTFVNLGPSDFEEKRVRRCTTTLVDPDVHFYPKNGTFSTEFTVECDFQGRKVRAKAAQRPSQASDAAAAEDTVAGAQLAASWQQETNAVESPSSGEKQEGKKRRKRVQNVEQNDTDSRKRQRLGGEDATVVSGNELQESERGVEAPRVRKSKKTSAKKSKEAPTFGEEETPTPLKENSNEALLTNPPSLVERLTGLTGNQDDPIYIPEWRRVKEHPDKPSPGPTDDVNMKNAGASNKEKDKGEKKKRKRTKAAKPVEIPDHGGWFKTLFCTLVIATCMSKHVGTTDWRIVAGAYESDPTFNVENAKKAWAWMQEHMKLQIESLSSTFQTQFLQAYENGEVKAIKNRKKYDWAALVKWASKACKYTEEQRLPMELEDIFHEYSIEVSKYQRFNRFDWYTAPLAHISRILRVSRLSFAVQAHDDPIPTQEMDENDLRARSWVRSNTATLQVDYDGTRAHNKFQTLDINSLKRAVDGLVAKKIIRMRKIRRLLPGRNYDFTRNLAANYKRPFDLDVWMEAIQFKKALDMNFASGDRAEDALTISRTETDGAVMALLSLANEGRIKITPILPPINNNLETPRPRLSKWGFVPGQYSRRNIDQDHLFWDIEVVPTSSYEFGNPLHPSHMLSTSGDTNAEGIATWLPLPEPPLPGKNDPNALLPIWSTIEGTKVIWPWWYRILNLVLQALMFQPGITAQETHNLCNNGAAKNGAAELFEIELVLQWLVSVHAITKLPNNTFETLNTFWAAFGDQLLGIEDDWFGEHVKKKKRKPHRLAYQPPTDEDGDEYADVYGPDYDPEANVPKTYEDILRVENEIDEMYAEEWRKEQAARAAKEVGGDGDVEMMYVGRDANANANVDKEGDVNMEDVSDADAEGEPDDELL